MGSLGARCAVVAALAALAVLPAAAGATPTVTEYDAGLAHDAGPMAVTAGPDGAVWFTEDSVDGVGRIAPDGSITEFAGLTRHNPHGITTGPDGNVWFTESSSSKGSIAKITPGGALTEYEAGLTYGAPQDISAGPDGNLWFTENGSGGAIGRITPSGVITEFTTGLTPNSSPWGITAGADGNLWFTEKFNAGRIGRITTSGVITEFGNLPAGLPQEIAAGPDGNLWFTAAASPGYIGRITPVGDVTAFSAGLTAGSSPQGIAAGPGGALYFTEKSGAAVGRITTAGEITEHTTGITANSAPFGIAAGPDGSMWFAENANPGRLARLALDPAPSAPPGSPPPTTTDPLLAASPAPPVSATAEPLPTLGQSIVVAPASGTIRVRRPGARAFTRVRGTLVTPVGSEIDARAGTAVLTSALDDGRVQKASFRGTYFKVRQRRGAGGLTDIVLTARLHRSARAGGARAAGATRRTPPSLWAHDRHGRYRTFGANSVASVRGTTWRTTERRAGTLTEVTSGSVSVRDLRRRRTVLVRAGHRYLARAR